MTTQFLFRDDSYLDQAEAEVTSVNEMGGITLDRTVFYATSGGQPGDSGLLRTPGGVEIAIATALHPDGEKTEIVHVPSDGQGLPQPGDKVTAQIDWARRHKFMRMHTALHLLSVVMPFAVTGGSIGEEKGRLDFDMPEAPEDVAAVEAALNMLVVQDHPVSAEWISEEELDANPGLVKTMKVKPPGGQGRIRLIRIGTGEDTVDLQPCGGTHVRSTSEIGALRIGKIEKKGKQNRRVNLHFADENPE